MMGLRPRQGNLRLVFRLFKSYARQASLKTSMRFPCLGLNPIIDSISLFVNVYQFVFVALSPFDFEDQMWDLIVIVPDHCLSFYCPNVVEEK